MPMKSGTRKDGGCPWETGAEPLFAGLVAVGAAVLVMVVIVVSMSFDNVPVFSSLTCPEH